MFFAELRWARGLWTLMAVAQGCGGNTATASETKECVTRFRSRHEDSSSIELAAVKLNCHSFVEGARGALHQLLAGAEDCYGVFRAEIKARAAEAKHVSKLVTKLMSSYAPLTLKHGGTSVQVCGRGC